MTGRKEYVYKRPCEGYPMPDVKVGDTLFGTFSGRSVIITEVFSEGYKYISSDDLPVDC